MMIIISTNKNLRFFFKPITFLKLIEKSGGKVFNWNTHTKNAILKHNMLKRPKVQMR